ncbi:MAG: alpha-1,4-glucan--maltose-1-phosphate maltosyltransferase [Acidimicrobiia bacterium]
MRSTEGEKSAPRFDKALLPPPPRVVIEAVSPTVDGGRFAAKSTIGEPLVVEADVFADGHDLVAADVQLVHDAEDVDPIVVSMHDVGNDRFRAVVRPSREGRLLLRVTAWIDRFASWRRDTVRKHEAGVDILVELHGAAGMMDVAASVAEAARAGQSAAVLRAGSARAEAGDVSVLDDQALVQLMRRWGERDSPARTPALPIVVDRERARFGAWYELFPRSLGTSGGHGTLRDCIEHLPYVAAMGFDVLYLPPVHPIGVSHRKGRNNATSAQPGDVGSPWAIGSALGGHRSIDPQLGDEDDFADLVACAREFGLEIALDLAFQCSPDHPWVSEHPSWFRHRADGSIQYAENPPKRYEDIYPLDFDTPDWRNLWDELLAVVLLWVDRGVHIFRVDNPHTKSFRMWEWLIATVKQHEPRVLFLAEAFTRPKVMRHLAKAGFTQSYTYFTWRTEKHEIVEYLTELTSPESRAFFRPNFWPNTPDILPEHLQFGGRAAFVARLVLAATLAANYGVYGPAFELMQSEPRPGAEEYVDNEKYELRDWDVHSPDSLAPVITLMNRIRRENRALQHDGLLRFHPTDNAQLLCYSKQVPLSRDPRTAVESNGQDADAPVLVVVNLDPHHRQRGFVDLDLDALGIDPSATFQVHDLFGSARFLWRGSRNFVDLDPAVSPAHIFRIRHHVRREENFDYYA